MPIEEAVNFGVAIDYHEKIVLVDMSLLPFFARELYVLVCEHRLWSGRREVPLNVLLVQDCFVIIKQVFLLKNKSNYSIDDKSQTY